MPLRRKATDWEIGNQFFEHRTKPLFARVVTCCFNPQRAAWREQNRYAKGCAVGLQALLVFASSQPLLRLHLSDKTFAR